ncbi:CPBP family intramembrane metalloprotease [Sphingomonas sp. AOB5]|uniref:CPBP family intramembrane glutamic endopeptidase n=1 Tax=Sphingomonas sp. AOB5 TaxID=3034017 RepID=UPI0023F6C8DA|nr:CPBP family intramembrane glutamic endopeptidase [Sphingomonas sp. AOB5]MDF7777702.1 CPBP family intramembrane metalloprotease [Sphingomonas sp. AOB5]
MAEALLIAAALYLAWSVLRARGWKARIAALLERHPAAHVYRGWAAGLWIALGFPALIGMALLGRDPFAMPFEFWIDWLPDFVFPVELFAGGMLGATLLNLAIALRRRHRGSAPARVLDFPLPKPMRMRETPWPALLSLSAGISEELYFRQFLPLLIVMVFDSLPLAVLLSAAAFSISHPDNPPRVQLAYVVAGLFFSVLYLGSGSLWLAILFHAIIDLNRLVIDPIAFWPRRTT